MTKQERWASLLGLAYRAGTVVSGDALVRSSVSGRKAYVVLVAQDAAANARKQWENKCDYYKIPLRYVTSRQTLGHAIGKDERVVVAVSEKGFATKLLTLLDENRG